MAGIKSIAVKSTRRAAAGLTPKIDLDDDEDAVVIQPRMMARPGRPAAAQPSHRFRIGERLNMTNGGWSITRAAATCHVVSLMPYEGRGSLMYRVRSDTEQFERVVSEADLSR